MYNSQSENVTSKQETGPRAKDCVGIVLFHCGLVIIASSAIVTLQPAMTARHWAPYVLAALGTLTYAAARRGQSERKMGARLLAALVGIMTLRLAREPQATAIPALAASMPAWLAASGLGLGTVGLLLAAFGAALVGSQERKPEEWKGNELIYTQAVDRGALLLFVIGSVAYGALSRLYEMDVTYLSMLLGGLVQYWLLARTMLRTIGRKGIGRAPLIYLGLALVVAFGRNLAAGAIMGGEGA